MTYKIISGLTVIISLFALLHSTGIITKFKLRVNIDGYLFPHSSMPNDSSDSFPIILPIVFANTGNHSGIIEDIILKIRNMSSNEILIYSPISIIDFQKFITEKRVLHAENIILPNFFPFSLNGKESCLKSVLFTQDNGIKGFPRRETKAGKYLVNVLVKANGKDYKNEFEFIIDFNEKARNEYNNGKTNYIGRINFPYNEFKLPSK